MRRSYGWRDWTRVGTLLRVPRSLPEGWDYYVVQGTDWDGTILATYAGKYTAQKWNRQFSAPFIMLGSQLSQAERVA